MRPLLNTLGYLALAFPGGALLAPLAWVAVHGDMAPLSFLDEHIGYRVGVGIYDGYEDWRTNTWSHWEDVNNEYMNLDVPVPDVFVKKEHG